MSSFKSFTQRLGTRSIIADIDAKLGLAPLPEPSGGSAIPSASAPKVEDSGYSTSASVAEKPQMMSQVSQLLLLLLLHQHLKKRKREKK